MIRRPPRSTPFPTRRSSDLLRPSSLKSRCLYYATTRYATGQLKTAKAPRTISALSPHLKRSEEHTSELQSHLNLVCRLLLEKKKISTESPNEHLILRQRHKD